MVHAAKYYWPSAHRRGPPALRARSQPERGPRIRPWGLRADISRAGAPPSRRKAAATDAGASAGLPGAAGRDHLGIAEAAWRAGQKSACSGIGFEPPPGERERCGAASRDAGLSCTTRDRLRACTHLGPSCTLQGSPSWRAILHWFLRVPHTIGRGRSARWRAAFCPLLHAASAAFGAPCVQRELVALPGRSARFRSHRGRRSALRRIHASECTAAPLPAGFPPAVRGASLAAGSSFQWSVLPAVACPIRSPIRSAIRSAIRGTVAAPVPPHIPPRFRRRCPPPVVAPGLRRERAGAL